MKQAVGPHEDITTIKKRKLKRYDKCYDISHDHVTLQRPSCYVQWSGAEKKREIEEVGRQHRRWDMAMVRRLPCEEKGMFEGTS